MFLLFIVFALSQSEFISTRNFYNGSWTYNGLKIFCRKEYPKSVPCDSINLLKNFWNYKISPSWILTLDNNCLGYTTNSSDVMGPCIDSYLGYVTQCSCSMEIPICCYQ